MPCMDKLYHGHSSKSADVFSLIRRYSALYHGGSGNELKEYDDKTVL